MTASPATFRSVFAVAEFRWLWTAQVLSVVGDQLGRVALTVLVFDRTASAGLAALTYALSFLPDLVGGAMLGHLADRHPRRTVMVVTDLARAALVAVMAVPVVPLPAQVALLVAVQLFAVPFRAARLAVLPDVLDGDRLTVGVGVMQTTYQLGLVAGFAAAGVVIAGLGAHGALAVDAVTFAVSAVVIRAGLGPHSPAAGADGERVSRVGHWATVAAGARLVVGDARLRSLLAIACCSGCYVVPEGLAVPYAVELGGGTAAVGWLLVANPLGTVLGIVVLRRVPPDRRTRWLGPAAVATSLALIPTWWARNGGAAAALWALSGLFTAHKMITQARYVAAEQRRHGRRCPKGVSAGAIPRRPRRAPCRRGRVRVSR